MTALHSRSFALLVLLGVPSILGGCATPAGDASDAEDVGAVDSPLAINPIRPGGPGGGTINPRPIGPTFAPPVTLPSYFDAGSRTATSVGNGWYENAVNPHTQIWRQKYDLDDNAVGAPTLIKTLTNAPTGATTFVDSAENTDDHSGPTTDRLNCYRVVETTGDCYTSPGGPDCLSTPQMACAYTQGAVAHQVGRVQLRIKVGSNSSAASSSNAHIQVRLQSPYMPYALLPQPRNNNTWIDSTQTDFTSSSNITYDLKTTNISDLSDITMITIANPGSDDLCINELELIADNTSVFTKSWGPANACAPTSNSDDSLNGKVVNTTFGELRRAPSWSGFNPPNLVTQAGLGTTIAPRSFVGFRHDELISYLDTAMADSLKNPAAGLGDDAGLADGSHTSITWLGYTRLRVVQSIVAKDEGWQGDISADVFYDLAIHTDAATCGAMNSCIKIENVGSISDFTGWSAFIPVLGALIEAVVDNAADGEIQKALNAMGASTLGAPTMGTKFCFLSGDSHVFESPFASLGFGAGSLTACLDSVF